MVSFYFCILLVVFEYPFFALAGLEASKVNDLKGAKAIVTPGLLRPPNRSFEVKKRQKDNSQKICGYVNGDPNLPRSVDAGWDCRIDTLHALWGICTTTVFSAYDCGFAAACFDSGTCSTGCGVVGVPGTTTARCSTDGHFCSTVLLNAGPDQTYSFIACGDRNTVETIFARATANPTKTTTAVTTAPAPSTSSTSSIIPPSTSSSKPSSSSSSNSSPSSSSSGSPPSSKSGSSTQTPSTPGADPVSVPTSNGAASQTNPQSPQTSSASESNSQAPNNIGPIVGGVIGGIALICFTIIALFYLNRYKTTQRKNAGPDIHIPWYDYRQKRQSRVHVRENTAMQVAGVHEKDAHKEQRWYEKDTTPIGSTHVRDTPFELPS